MVKDIFTKNYKGPKGKHLSNMTHFTKTGQPKVETEGFKGT